MSTLSAPLSAPTNVSSAPAPSGRSELINALSTFRTEFAVVGLFSGIANLMMLAPTMYMLHLFAARSARDPGTGRSVALPAASVASRSANYDTCVCWSAALPREKPSPTPGAGRDTAPVRRAFRYV